MDTSIAVSLKEYLKKYDGNTEVIKKKSKKPKLAATGVLVVDKDHVWQNPATIEEEEDDNSADEVQIPNYIVGDISPSRQKPNLPKNDDMSPPRRKRPHSPTNLCSVEDISPPRPSTQRIDAPRTGLLSAEEMKKEIARKKKDELAWYKELDPAVSGRGAEPIYRDKAGNRISKDDFLKLQKRQEKPKENDLEWGTGLAQKREAEVKQRELELEKKRPFARTKDDPDLDKMLKEQDRWGDPMAHLVKLKQSALVLEDFGENERMKESGFIIPQSIASHSWIGRQVDAPANRYGIKPGRHWDGVDRSNGCEKDCFKRSNEKQANKREAYLWSVSDM